MSKTRIALAAVLGLSGCSDLHYKPLTYTNVNDMRPGPGVFSGREGAFVIFRDDKPLDLRRGSTTEPDPSADQADGTAE
jgi:hypothetical protein